MILGSSAECCMPLYAVELQDSCDKAAVRNVTCCFPAQLRSVFVGLCRAFQSESERRQNVKVQEISIPGERTLEVVEVVGS